ncbi:MAG: DUF4860 domain-containing protein [Lachnospiraceae bacterium]|nr:DUF4860 domain-containing protein [Lachnospiraceae bacterium]
MEQSLKKRLQSFLPIILFVVFAICLMGLTVLSARVYEQVQKERNVNFAETTCADYIRTKVGNYDELEKVDIGSFGEGDAIYLYETIDGETYETILYVFDGYLMEQYQQASSEVLAGAGNKIMEADDLEIEKDSENILSCKILIKDSWEEVKVSIRSGIVN